jgi:putative proteasome-type protease
LLIVSFDSTVKSNLSVGLPLDIQLYDNDSFSTSRQKRVEATDQIYQSISAGWGDALKEAFVNLPSYTV